MTLQLCPRRRFLLFGVLPASLLMIAVPLAPHLVPQVQEAFRDINRRQVTPVPAKSLDTLLSWQAPRTDGVAPRILPSVEDDLRRHRRRVALDIVSRLEGEARRQGSHTRLSPLDLKRLRNGLRETASASTLNHRGDFPVKQPLFSSSPVH